MSKEQIIRIKGDTSDFEKKLDQMSASMEQAGRKMQNIGRSLSKYVTLPLVAAGTASFMAAKDFEASMSKITGLVGVASDQVEQWKDDLIKLGPELGKTPTELADALFFVTSAGLRGAEALDVLRMSAKASVAGLGETKVVADLVTSAMNAYGVANLNATQATDILVASVREGKAEATELAASMGQVLPIAAELGVTFDQVGGAMAAMTRTGTNAATAATQLRAIMVGVMRPSKQAADTLEEMGTSAANLRKQIREEGLLSALTTIRELTNKFGEDAMSIVFPNIRALAGVLDLMGSNMEDNVQIMHSVADATGSLEKAFEEASNTAQFKWDQAMASANATLITMGDTVKIAIIPILERFTAMMEKLAGWFRELDPQMRKLVVTIGGVAAAAGPLLVIIGTFTRTVLPALITGLKSLRVAALGPVGIAVGAVYGAWQLWNRAILNTKKYTEELTGKTLPELEREANKVRRELHELMNPEVDKSIGGALRESLKMALPGVTGAIDTARKAKLVEQLKVLDQQVEQMREQQKAAAEIESSNANITKEIEAQLSAMMDMNEASGGGALVPDPPIAPMTEFAEIIEKTDEEILKLLDDVEVMDDGFVSMGERIEYVSDMMRMAQDAAMSFGDAVMSAGIRGGQSLQEFGDTVKRIAKQNISAMIAEAVAGAVKSALITVPFPFNIAAGATAGGLAAALFNQIPGFATGGVVPPGYPNDSYLARLTSGETITPAGQSPSMKLEVVGHRIPSGDLLFSVEQAKNRFKSY